MPHNREEITLERMVKTLEEFKQPEPDHYLIMSQRFLDQLNQFGSSFPLKDEDQIGTGIIMIRECMPHNICLRTPLYWVGVERVFDPS